MSNEPYKMRHALGDDSPKQSKTAAKSRRVYEESSASKAALAEMTPQNAGGTGLGVASILRRPLLHRVSAIAGSPRRARSSVVRAGRS